MPTVSLTDYTSQQAEIERRQKLADLLSEQGQQDIPIQSYNGVEAAIPWTAVLAKALNSGLGAYESRKASQSQDALHKTMMSDYSNAANSYFGGPQGPTPAALAAALPQPARNDDYAAAAAMPPPVAQMPPQMAQPAPAPPPMPPPQQMAPPAPPNAPPEPQSPPAATSVAPPASPVQERAAAAQAKMQKALAIQNRFGQQAAAPFIKDASEQLKAVQDLQDKAAEKEADRQQDVQHATQLVGLLPLAPDQKALLGPIAQVGGTKMLMPAVEQLQKNALGPHETYLAPAEAVKMGFNPGSIVSVNDVTHAAKLIFDPTPTKQAQQRIALEGQSVAIARGNLALRGAEFNRDNLSAPTTVEHIVNGEPVQTTAMFDKKHGRYVDMTGNPVDPTGLRVLPAGSSRATLGLLRVSTAAADAATGIENLSKLPANSNMGWFSQASNTTLGGLRRTLTPQEAQDMRATAAGLSRAMGGLATGGLAVDIPTQQSYEALIPQAGQSRLTALRQMGELRQQAENGIDSALANPYITPQQKVNLTAAKQKIANAVPWTPSDVSKLETSNNPNATMRGMGVGTLPAAAHAPYADPGKEARYQAWLKAHGGH